MAQITVSKVSVEIPFDLNKIFSLQYEFQPLKEVLEYIFVELKKNSDKIHSVDTKLVSKMMLFDKLKNSNEDNRKSIDGIKAIQKELESKSLDTDQSLSHLKSDLESCKMNMSLFARQLSPIATSFSDVETKLEEFGKRMKEIESQVAMGNLDSNGGSNNKSDFGEYLKRLEKCEKKSKKAKDIGKKQAKKHKKWKPQWLQMQKDIDELKQLISDKVGWTLFNEEVDKLKDLINQLANSGHDIKVPLVQSGTSISSKELIDIKEALKKVAEHEVKLKSLDSVLERLNALQEKSNKSILDIQKLDLSKADKHNVEVEQKKVWREIEELKNQCTLLDDLVKRSSGGSGTDHGLHQRVDKVEDITSMLQRSLEEYRTIKTMHNSNNETRDSINDEFVFRDMGARVNQLQQDLESMRIEFIRWIKEFQDGLNQKADIEGLKNLEDLLMERINDIVKALTKQLADKNDTKKALKLLERQLKNLYELFMSKGQGGTYEHEDDAMFTKKPLGGMSCASCEKDVINLYGKKVDYLPWGKFPFRDPSERIARVGKGFSKMLSMINPDALSRYETVRTSSLNQHQIPGHLNMKKSVDATISYAHKEEIEDQVHNITLNNSNNKMGSVTRTQNNFYHAQSLQDSYQRPGSAQVPKPRIKNTFVRNQRK